ncbi:LacI family DNA-binding transcriptional regulator [Clostridium sediminicola]|uniref:LacI family DNA-binding transcriptional regulator n=1 Tax=Clostridium sediminicola TaxID=3114879 RepID=UPI0031F22CA6
MKKDGTKSVFPTLIDVAKSADVSPITVSRVYNPKWEGKVRQSTVDKVLKAAKEIGYNPNGVARSLNSQRTNIIAVVMGMETGYFYAEVLNKLIHKIQESGRQALVFVADLAIGMEKVVAQVNQYRVDAIIVTSPATKSNIMNYFTNSKIPLILFNREVMNSNASAVWSDSIKAVNEIADFIFDNGFKHIGYIAGKNENERNESFITKLKNHSIEPVYVIEGDFTYKSGYKLATKMISSKKRPDIIFCCGDNMAMGAMDAARGKFGLDVPNDISIIGFDDNSAASLEAYDLTTMRQSVDDLVNATIEVIEELLENPEKQILRRYDMELIIRSSVKVLTNGNS